MWYMYQSSYMILVPRMTKISCYRSSAICANGWWQRIPAILNVRVQTSALLKGSNAYNELCNGGLELIKTLACMYTVKKRRDQTVNGLVQKIHTSFCKSRNIFLRFYQYVLNDQRFRCLIKTTWRCIFLEHNVMCEIMEVIVFGTC